MSEDEREVEGEVLSGLKCVPPPSSEGQEDESGRERGRITGKKGG